LEDQVFRYIFDFPRSLKNLINRNGPYRNSRFLYNCTPYFIESDLSEYGATDLNSDGNVNFRDFAAFAPAFSTVSGGPGWDSACDLFPAGGDGVIDFDDLRVLASDWLGGVE